MSMQLNPKIEKSPDRVKSEICVEIRQPSVKLLTIIIVLTYQIIGLWIEVLCCLKCWY